MNRLSHEQMIELLGRAPEGATHVDLYPKGSTQRPDRDWYKATNVTDVFEGGWQVYVDEQQGWAVCDGRTMDDLYNIKSLEDLRMIVGETS